MYTFMSCIQVKRETENAVHVEKYRRSILW